MSPQAWIAVGVAAACFAGFVFTRIAPELILVGGVGVLLLGGILTPEQALAGLANEGMITVALMYVLAAGLRETGAIDFLIHHVLGRPRTERGAIVRMLFPVAGVSAFLNNTPVVAALVPAVMDWSKRLRISPSKLLIPLSYSAILGGTLTLIGTSTNLAVNGLLLSRGNPGFSLFDLTGVGLVALTVGSLYLIWLAPRRLPARVPVHDVFDNPKEYTVEMTVEENGSLVGKSVEQAGLRHLPGLYLVEIVRDGEILAAVGPYERLQGGDRLVFAGVVDAVVELQRFRGLRPCADQTFTLQDRKHRERVLVEAVVSPRCALVGKTIREGRFRMTYGGSVIAAARAGHRIQGKIGDIRLQAGDALLLDVRPPFLERHRNSGDFLLISPVSEYLPVRHDRAWLAWLILGAVIVCGGTGLLSMFKATLLGAGLMLATGCCSLSSARKSLDGQVLLCIAASFGIGRGLEVTGAAAYLADQFLRLADGTPWLTLAFTYASGSILTEIITNNAVAVILFPIVMALAVQLGVDPKPFLLALMISASASFATPLGYQTNLMVYGPGGYRFTDFLKFGLPMNILVGIASVLAILWLWPL
ncbi:SLC13 family permease [Methylohalobius crimeensis]|uniref:SLC13 family permease n=1 Tax=Methylohalobius crimeensis TaxID=244365 RepID=UPI0003B65351|nr:SLC13 family permease [Methylohalobius crimeensis]